MNLRCTCFACAVGTTVAEFSGYKVGCQDILLIIFSVCLQDPRSALLDVCSPQVINLHTEMVLCKSESSTTRPTTSVCICAGWRLDRPAPATTLHHLMQRIESKITELGIYPAVDPLNLLLVSLTHILWGKSIMMWLMWSRFCNETRNCRISFHLGYEMSDADRLL